MLSEAPMNVHSYQDVVPMLQDKAPEPAMLALPPRKSTLASIPRQQWSSLSRSKFSTVTNSPMQDGY